MWDLDGMKKLASPATWWEDLAPKGQETKELRKFAIYVHSVGTSIGDCERLHSQFTQYVPAPRCALPCPPCALPCPVPSPVLSPGLCWLYSLLGTKRQRMTHKNARKHLKYMTNVHFLKKQSQEEIHD